ncbi:hypothetical protein JTE90_007516 [Oedothorax gibbosus]|uniref:Uncharacterized protein n=1 Tax=Oedothorax gibbosus TaxID=931172 RepID=A0AAV6VNH1_9ARAC|nr:hypothetical protein JTE90_007516 [Oedothorax gibbosus]
MSATLCIEKSIFENFDTWIGQLSIHPLYIISTTSHFQLYQTQKLQYWPPLTPEPSRAPPPRPNEAAQGPLMRGPNERAQRPVPRDPLLSRVSIVPN